MDKKLVLKTGGSRSRSYLVHRISMSIQRGDAASILSSMSPEDKLDEIFYL